MKKEILAKQKSRGRPATGITPMMGFRADPEIRAEIARWAEYQSDNPSLSEAIRRLVELGLTAKTKARTKNEGQKRRARETIDEMADTTANQEDQASRKRRLIKGPEEFQHARIDRSTKK